MKTVYDIAKEEEGTWEWAEGHNPKIVQWFADVGHPWVKDDETAWCAAFVGAMLQKAGLPSTRALNARSYLDWGTPVDLADAEPGDVVTFPRGDIDGWQGHVAFYERQDDQSVYVLGGNQLNQVNIKPYPKDKVLGVRRMEPPRSSPIKSTTLQASATAAVSGATGVATAVSALDGTAQIVIIVAACVAALALLWIMRERIRKWGKGDR